MNLNSETSIDRANLDIPVYNAFYADFSSKKKTKEGVCIFKGFVLLNFPLRIFSIKSLPFLSKHYQQSLLTSKSLSQT